MGVKIDAVRSRLDGRPYEDEDRRPAGRHIESRTAEPLEDPVRQAQEHAGPGRMAARDEGGERMKISREQ